MWIQETESDPTMGAERDEEADESGPVKEGIEPDSRFFFLDGTKTERSVRENRER